MSKLIDDLEREHRVLIEVLESVKKLGFNTKEGLDKLISIKTALLAHLKKEDADLYPILKRDAIKDDVLKQTLDFFAKDTEEISKFAMQFFEKYAQGGQGNEFARDFGKLSQTLSSRMRKEETSIYREFRKLHP